MRLSSSLHLCPDGVVNVRPDLGLEEDEITECKLKLEAAGTQSPTDRDSDHLG